MTVASCYVENSNMKRKFVLRWLLCCNYSKFTVYINTQNDQSCETEKWETV